MKWFATGFYATRRSMSGGPGYQGPVTDHFDGRCFFNLDPRASAGRNFGDFWRWQRTRRPAEWPEWVENRAKPALPAALGRDELALTFVNHITLLIQLNGINVLTDPVYSERVSPVGWAGPRRVRAPGLPYSELPAIDLVLVSHNHYDHLDLDTLARLQATHAPRIVTTLGNGAFLRDHGLRNVDELDWWQSLSHRDASLTLTPAQHWSGRGLAGRNRTLWGGFVIQQGPLRIYFAGDTGYAAHFAAIRERFGAMDLSLLPIGAYEPRWFMRDQHMDPADAVRAHRDLESRLSIGTHFGCFQLTDEGIDAPVIALRAALAHDGTSPGAFRVLEVGETLVLPAARN